MKLDPHHSILEIYFFSFIDRGVGADETPLFTRCVDGQPLSSAIAAEFHLTVSEADAAINLARQEVAL